MMVVRAECPYAPAEVTPSVAPAGALTALEAGTVGLFQRSTRSVVNVVDLTVLSGQAMKSGTLVPEVGGPTGRRRGWKGLGTRPYSHCLRSLYAQVAYITCFRRTRPHTHHRRLSSHIACAV
jgi:hypothetical protein